MLQSKFQFGMVPVSHWGWCEARSAGLAFVSKPHSVFSAWGRCTELSPLFPNKHWALGGKKYLLHTSHHINSPVSSWVQEILWDIYIYDHIPTCSPAITHSACSICVCVSALDWLLAVLLPIASSPVSRHIFRSSSPMSLGSISLRPNPAFS